MHHPQFQNMLAALSFGSPNGSMCWGKLLRRAISVVLALLLSQPSNAQLSGILGTGKEFHFPVGSKLPTPQVLFDETLEYFLKREIGNVLPIRLDSTDALPTVPDALLPGGAFHGKRLTLTLEEASRPLPPGDYEVYVLAFCMQFSVHRPGRGAPAIIGPLTGTQAGTIGKLLWRGIQARKDPHELQDVAWAIQSGVPFDKMSKPYQDEITTLVPEAKTSLEQGSSLEKAIRGLYDDIVANPRKYIIQYKHEKGWKWPDMLIPNVRVSALSFDQTIAKMGKAGEAYLAAERDQQMFLASLVAEQHGQERPFVASTDPPVPPTQGPWTVRVPGRVYMRAIVQGGNMQTDNLLQIRVLPETRPVAQIRGEQRHLIPASYSSTQQSQAGRIVSYTSGPTVLALMGASRSDFTQPLPNLPPPPFIPGQVPPAAPTLTIPPATIETPTTITETTGGAEAVETTTVIETVEEGGLLVVRIIKFLPVPQLRLIFYSLIAAQALIMVLPQVMEAVEPAKTRKEGDHSCPDEVLNSLTAEQGLRCGVGMGCSGPTFQEKTFPLSAARQQYCQRIANNISSFRRCIAARQKLMDECYEGGDPSHKDTVKNIEAKGLAKCLSYSSQYCPAEGAQ